LRAGKFRNHAIKDADQPFDDASLVHIAAVARTDGDPILLATTAEGRPNRLDGISDLALKRPACGNERGSSAPETTSTQRFAC
jgi:hypothetical protein